MINILLSCKKHISLDKRNDTYPSKENKMQHTNHYRTGKNQIVSSYDECLVLQNEYTFLTCQLYNLIYI